MAKPTMTPIEVPRGRGKGVAEYLSSYGIMDKIPAIRSTDYNIVSRCPFSYYLTRRLGLVSATSIQNSAALNVGSYIHCLYEHNGNEDVLAAVKEDRARELKEICEAIGEPVDSYLKEDEVEFAQAVAVYQASHAYEYPFDASKPTTRYTLSSYLDKRFEVLDRETLLSVRDKDFSRTCLTMQSDLLLYEPSTDLVWILDYKSTSMPPKQRAMVCEFEFQARHYLYIAEQMLYHICKLYKLPRSAKIGGIIHAILYKPNVRFGLSDRPYHYVSVGRRTKMHGAVIPARDSKQTITHYLAEVKNAEPPFEESREVFHDLNLALKWLHDRTGKKPEKEFVGEPSIDLHISRVMEAYDSQLTELDGTPVCLVESPIDQVLDEDGRHEYLAQLKMVYSYAKAPAIPCLFPRSEAGVRPYKGGSPIYYPFYVLEPEVWPDVIEKFNFVQRWRDDENEKIT